MKEEIRLAIISSRTARAGLATVMCVAGVVFIISFFSLVANNLGTVFH